MYRAPKNFGPGTTAPPAPPQGRPCITQPHTEDYAQTSTSKSLITEHWRSSSVSAEKAASPPPPPSRFCVPSPAATMSVEASR